MYGYKLSTKIFLMPPPPPTIDPDFPRSHDNIQIFVGFEPIYNLGATTRNKIKPGVTQINGLSLLNKLIYLLDPRHTNS